MEDFEKQMMQKATEIMESQPGLKKQSEIREKYKFQEEPFWGAGDDSLSEKDIERRPCTKEEKEDLNRSIEKMGDLFQDADFYWNLDGALNISLYVGDYIGVHKDIDMSFDVRELEKVEQFLGKKGFGLFLSSGHQSGKNRIFERISAKRLQNNPVGFQPMIFAIDENGAIKYGQDSFGIDTHIIRWGDNNEPIVGHNAPIPKEWLDPEVIAFHGRKINCSNPALVAFHKLFFTRAYDDNDLKLLAQNGKLKQEDIALIEKTFDTHIESMQKMIHDYIERIFPNLSSAKGKQEIFDALINDSLISDRKNDKETQKAFRDISEKISFLENRTVENVYETIFATTPANETLSKKKNRLAILRENTPTNK